MSAKKKKPSKTASTEIFKTAKKTKVVNPDREQQYIQKLKCVLCQKILAIMGTHRHNPGPVICPKCLTKKNKQDAKKPAKKTRTKK